MLLISILLLIPLCISLYFVLFQEISKLQETHAVPDNDTVDTDFEADSSNPELQKTVEEQLPVKVEGPVSDQMDDSQWDDENFEEPMDYIDYEEVQREWEETDQAANENMSTLESPTDERIIFEAQKFASLHFNSTIKDGFFNSYKLRSRDDQFATVLVIRTDSRNWKKENYIVALAISDGQVQALSIQEVEE